MSAQSQALTKRQSDTSLMPPPPPPKRIKRAATVLDEDVYTNSLSEIIARDYFPGLLEAQVKQEYLDALDSKDKEWIASSKKKLTGLMRTPGRARSRLGSASMTPQRTGAGRPGNTPMGWGGDTPMSVMSAASSSTTPNNDHVSAPDVSRLGLLEFQAKYTSEDNESFNKALDKQNEKHRERYKWLWSGNKIPTARQIAHRRREVKRIEAQGGNADQHKQVAIKTDLDVRPANPDTWKSRPENSLMFTPSSVEDSYETTQQKAEASSRAGPKRVVFQNTRLPDGVLHQTSSDATAPPPSPSISAIKDAIAGRPHPTESEPGYTGSETPRVNGYAFVDEDEPEYLVASSKDDGHAISLDDLRLLGSSDATPNPFEIKENRRREDIHHRMVDLVARSRRAEKSIREAKTPVTPRFASSPRLDFGLRTLGAATPGRTNKALTPAAQKLLHQVGSTPRLGSSATSSLRNMWTPTPRRGK
ncbi:nuclear protein Es2 [Aspergillus sclerotioniger CBS 115572]|uniref:Nuclear protein Es2 n=1 Tax=Aspergillus sclerotioniger CBS 115572 TaxID=1450535 RepID=A0A317WGU6_9EURO|nr:nuclear protein Es2 [Aspergillus sclerotioniger CBS 115572]PWY85684.1 nuclear protein Es2 [Aspergillus sclerotioniger CBS 115572]